MPHFGIIEMGGRGGPEDCSRGNLVNKTGCVYANR